MKVSKNYSESTVSKILELVENASANKAKTEKFMTKVARYYTPIVFFLALSLAIIPPLLLANQQFQDWIYRALIFLVVSCPCALVISIPLGFFGGIGKASKNGILVKGGNYLEALNTIDTLVFDKTGTLTKGIFEVSNIKSLSNLSEDRLLELAAYGESFSNHPISKAILRHYGKPIDKTIITNYTVLAGLGVKLTLNNQELILGNKRFLENENIPLHKADPPPTGTIVFIAINKELSGYIILNDTLKEDAKNTIDSLRKLHIKNLVILTGDSKEVSHKVGQTLGITEVYSKLLPQDKVAKFNEISNKAKGTTIFIGDGMNDAPVLSGADVGIAMGGLGSDAAIDAADIVIMNDEPSKIITGIEIAKLTRKIIWQNIFFAFGVKFLILTLSAFGLASMWGAVFADVGVALIAIINSLRIMKT